MMWKKETNTAQEKILQHMLICDETRLLAVWLSMPHHTVT